MSDTRRAAIRTFVDAIQRFRKNDSPGTPEFGPFIDAITSSGTSLIAQLHDREHRTTIRAVRKLCDDVTPSSNGLFSAKAVQHADPLIDELEDLFDALTESPAALGAVVVNSAPVLATSGGEVPPPPDGLDLPTFGGRAVKRLYGIGIVC